MPSKPKFDLSDGQYQAIGKIVSSWSLLEYELANLFCILMRITREEALWLVPKLQSPHMVKWSLSELQRRYPADAEKLGDLLTSIESSKEKRDTIAHNPWAFDIRPDATGKMAITPFVAMRPSRRGNQKEAKAYPEPVLIEIANEIREERKVLIRFLLDKKIHVNVFPLSMLGGASL